MASPSTVAPQHASTDMAVLPSVDAKRAMDVLLASEGNLDLACELLGTPAEPLPKAALVKALADDPTALQRALRVFSMIEAHDLRRKVKLIAEVSVNDLEPEEAMEAYVKISDQLQELTKPQQTKQGDNNYFAFVLDNMPREAATVIRGLATTDQAKREELRRIAQARAGGPQETVEGEYKALPSPRAGAKLDEERGARADATREAA